MKAAFEVVCELEPPATPDLTQVHDGIDKMRGVAARFLVPDNHLGRATVSSIAVAREVIERGARAVACLNARDRNRLGMRRDLLTAAAYGIDEFLFVYGDRPRTGGRAGDLTVATMLEEARRFTSDHAEPLRVGVAAGLSPPPAWKLEADALYCQVGPDLERLRQWRASFEFSGSVYAGVIVLASPVMARRLAATIPGFVVPPSLLDALARDRLAGVEAACELVEQLASTGDFEGVHLVPVRRYGEVAARLGPLLRK